MCFDLQNIFFDTWDIFTVSDFQSHRFLRLEANVIQPDPLCNIKGTSDSFAIKCKSFFPLDFLQTSS